MFSFHMLRVRPGWLALWILSALQVVAEPVTDSESVSRGDRLAHQYCAACHLFPEPDLLDRHTWQHHALRKMAPFLGVAQVRMENRPDGARLTEANLFPPSPILPKEDWFAIHDYYLAKAPTNALPQPPHDPIVADLTLFTPEKLTLPGSEPLTTLVSVDAATHEIRVGDVSSGSLVTFRDNGTIARRLSLGGAPVDLVQDGPRLIATLIGHVYPSDVPDGQVLVLPTPGGGDLPVPIATRLMRPVQCLPADLNGDGLTDYLICSFGNYLGRLSWFERKRLGGFEEHVLLDFPGAVHAVIRDFDGDGRPDLLVLMAQGKEGLYLFTNAGNGEFRVRPLLQFHPAFGSIHFELADMNGDGIPDVILTNGDNGEYPSPFKRYHGVRIYLNDGQFNLREAAFYPVNGAFKTLARDFDGDGDLDLAVISFFPDFSRAVPEGFVYLENRGGLKFAPHTFPGATMGRWISMDAADVDGDGDVDLVLGAFSQGPPAIEIPPALQASWKTNGVNALILRNTRIRATK